MAQERLWNYKAGLNSNEMNRVLLGILEPARYRGFDYLITSASLNFTLDHNGTGIAQTKEDLTATTKKGIILTKQGIVIQEDAAIALTCLTNVSNSSARTDLVVCQHQDVNVVGGQAAIYLVIPGANGTTAAPALTNPTYQIIVGTITIPANATDLDGADYVPAQCPLPGGHTLEGVNFPELINYVKRNVATLYSKYQSWGLSEALVAATTSSVIYVPDTGNSFEIDINDNVNYSDIQRTPGPAPFPNGTVINIRIRNVDPGNQPTLYLGSISNICSYNDDAFDKYVPLYENDTITLVKGASQWILLSINGHVMRRIDAIDDDIVDINNAPDWIMVDAYTGYRKDRNVVYLKGVAGAVGTSMGSVATSLVLPIGYRPSAPVTFPGTILIDNGTCTFGTLTIATNGNVTHSALTGAGVARHTLLNGISFPIN